MGRVLIFNPYSADSNKHESLITLSHRELANQLCGIQLLIFPPCVMVGSGTCCSMKTP